MARHREAPLRRLVVQKRLDLGAGHLGWMAEPVKSDEGAALVHVRFFGADAVVRGAYASSHLVHQTRRP